MEAEGSITRHHRLPTVTDQLRRHNLQSLKTVSVVEDGDGEVRDLGSAVVPCEDVSLAVTLLGSEVHVDGATSPLAQQPEVDGLQATQVTHLSHQALQVGVVEKTVSIEPGHGVTFPCG